MSKSNILRDYSLRELIAINVPNRLLNKVHFNHNGVIQGYVERKFGALAREIADSTTSAEATPYTNNTIWVFWAQGRDRMPEIVKRCVKQIEKMRGDYQVVLLTQETYAQYVDIPDYMLRKLGGGKITLTHFSDILRFALLAKYGGWWLDATIYPLCPLEQRSSLYTVKTEHDPRYVSEAKWTGFLWYMPAGHPMARFGFAALKKYWEEHESLIEYFLIDHFIRLFYDTSKAFRQEIDDNKSDCRAVGLYFIQSKEALQPFDENRWREICALTRFFKCNWRTLSKFDGIEPQSYVLRL